VPSKSGKQHRLMALVANDPKAAKRLGIPQKVGKEFMKKDKGKKFSGGGASEDMPIPKRIKATTYKALNKVAKLPFKAAEYVERKTTKDPEKRVIKKNVIDVMEKQNAENEKGAYFKKGGSVKSSASSRADGIAQRGKTRGKFI
jgi:late competence protein required for DNA uptake (superfamily II DNA/RNA helicase)